MFKLLKSLWDKFDAFESEHSTPFSDIHDLDSDYSSTHSLHTSSSHDMFDSDPFGHDTFSSPGINPANGLPMINDAIDIEGNAFGTSSDMGIGLFDSHDHFSSHDPFSSHDSFSSFDSHDSFSSFNDPFS